MTMESNQIFTRWLQRDTEELVYSPDGPHAHEAVPPCAWWDESLRAWLRKRGPAFQDEVLGPTRARMFRTGDLTTSQLLDAATGKPLMLEELGA